MASFQLLLKALVMADWDKSGVIVEKVYVMVQSCQYERAFQVVDNS